MLHNLSVYYAAVSEGKEHKESKTFTTLDQILEKLGKTNSPKEAGELVTFARLFANNYENKEMLSKLEQFYPFYSNLIPQDKPAAIKLALDMEKLQEVKKEASSVSYSDKEKTDLVAGVTKYGKFLKDAFSKKQPSPEDAQKIINKPLEDFFEMQKNKDRMDLRSASEVELDPSKYPFEYKDIYSAATAPSKGLRYDSVTKQWISM